LVAICIICDASQHDIIQQEQWIVWQQVEEHNREEQEEQKGVSNQIAFVRIAPLPWNKRMGV
jgi:hypothetical protein